MKLYFQKSSKKLCILGLLGISLIISGVLPGCGGADEMMGDSMTAPTSAAPTSEAPTSVAAIIETIFATIPSDPSNFTLGDSPDTATFGGDAMVFTAMVPSLYIAPSHNAWGLAMTDGIGTINFTENPASKVSVQVLGGPGAIATLTAFDPDSVEIDSINVPTSGFQTVEFDGPVGSLELENTVNGTSVVIGEFIAEF